jgi:lipopolysaccharide transport system ATP-binding protein
MRLGEVLVNGGAGARIEPGGPIRVEVAIEAAARPLRAWLGASIHRGEDGLALVNEHVDLGTVAADQRVSLTIDRLDLAPGAYHLDVGVYEEDWEHAYDYHWAAYPIEVAGPRRSGGEALLRPPARWSVEGAGLTSADRSRTR